MSSPDIAPERRRDAVRRVITSRRAGPLVAAVVLALAFGLGWAAREWVSGDRGDRYARDRAACIDGAAVRDRRLDITSRLERRGGGVDLAVFEACMGLRGWLMR